MALRVWVAIFVVVGAGCGRRQSALGVEHAVATLGFAEAPVAAFLTVTNTGPEDALIALESDAAVQVWVATQQAHRNPGTTAGGVNGMPPLLMPSGAVPIRARGATHLSPSGHLIAFYRLTRPVREGDTLPLRLRFQSGATVDTHVPVVDFADVEAVIDPQAAARIPPGEVPTVELGRDLYRANGCAACHGSDGRGDGPIAATLIPRPRDLADPESYRMGTEVDVIARTLAAGLPAAGSMPLYAHLSNHERHAMALFIRSLHSPPR